MNAVGRGTLLADRYRLEEQLTKSAHSSLWRGVDTTLDRKVAIRLIAADTAGEALDAARRAALVDDPRLVRVLDVAQEPGTGEHASQTYVVSEWIEAKSIADLLDDGVLSSARVRMLVGEASEALAVAARQGLHHLALDPTSVLLTSDGSVRVHGLAVDAAARGGSQPTGEAAERVDAVGLVALIYAGLTGRWPLRTSAHHASLDTAPMIGDSAVPPADIVSGVPNDLDTLCAVTFGPNHDGPASPAELARQLKPWARSHAAPVVHPNRRLADDLRSAPRRPPSRFPVRLAPTQTEFEPEQSDVPIAVTDDATPVAGVPGVGLSAASSARADQPTQAQPIADLRGATAWEEESNEPEVVAGTPEARSTPDASSASAVSSSSAAISPPARPSADQNAPARTSRLGSALDAVAAARAGAAAVPAAAPSPASAPAKPAPAKPTPAKPASPVAAPPAAPAERASIARGNDDPNNDLNNPQPDLSPRVPPTPPEQPPAKPAKRRSSPWPLLTVVALVVIGLVLAVWSLRGGSNAGQAASASASSTASASATSTVPAAAAPEIASATGFDPQGDGAENNSQAALAIDGNSATSWKSSHYNSAAFGNLKKGLGLLITLKAPAPVSKVSVTVDGQGGTVEIRTATGSTLDGSQVVATGPAGTLEKTLDPAPTTQYLIVWFTQLPRVDGQFRAQVAEVSVS